jgi:diaminopimelate epimerase
VDVERIGARIEHDPLFPARVNVEFVQVKDRGRARMRVWERGVGVTRACGTGACATAVAAVRRGLTDRKVVVELDGGELQIEWRESDGHVLMTGPVELEFRGELP